MKISLINQHAVKIMACCLLESFLPHLEILNLPMLLKIGQLDAGIPDEANEVDSAFVESLVPLLDIIEASVECRGNVCIIWGFGHVFPPLLHLFNDGEGTINSGSGAM